MINNAIDSALQDGALLLTVNRRLARALHHQFQQNRIADGVASWPTPLIMPIDAWLRALHTELLTLGSCNRVLLDGPQELVLWQRILNDSDMALLNHSATASSLSSAWRTHQSYVSVEPLNQSYFGEDQSAYAAWAAQYQEALQQNNWVDASSLSTLLLDYLDDLRPLVLVPDLIQLAGFNSVTAQHQLLLEGFAASGVEVIERLAPLSLPVNASVEIYECVDADQELQAMAYWARSQWESNRAVSLGCVIADLHQRRTQVMRVFDSVFFPQLTPAEIIAIGRPYDISLGKPLLQWPLVASAMAILNLAIQGLSGAPITHFLLSPYLGQARTERDGRAAFDRRLRKLGISSVNMHQLQQFENTPAALKRQLLLLQKVPHAQGTVSVWCQRISDMLSAMGWPGEAPLDSQEHQAFEAWQDSLANLVSLEDMLEKVTAYDMLQLLKEQFSQRLFQPETPQLPIQVVGMLESAGLNFDGLWVTGMDANSWPQQARPDPWLPQHWQKAVAVPTASHSLALLESEQTFAQWMQAAGKRIFSFAQMQDGQEFDAAYPLLELLRAGTPKVQPAPRTAIAQCIAEAVETVEIDDDSGPLIDDEMAARGGARLFEDQASCPFSAFAKHRLLAQPLEEPELGLDPREQGNAFHLAIERFWESTGTHANLLRMDDDVLRVKIEDCVDQALLALKLPASPILGLEKERLMAALQYWLDRHEKIRSPFSIDQLEAEIEAKFAGIGLKLKVDRIDQLESGQKIIIDYKTGARQQPAKWMQERPGGAQLPLYATLVDGIDGLCYAQVKRRSMRFVGKASEKGLITGLDGPAKIDGKVADWAANLEFWRERLGLLAAEIKAGHATVTPQPDACIYCPLASLCRIDPDIKPLSDKSPTEGAVDE